MRFTLIFVFAVRAFACNVLAGDRITGKDLAAANPIFTALDPGVILGAAPLPPAQRVLHAGDLLRIARLNGIAITGPIGEVCFERSTEVLTPEELLPVLRAALGMDDAKIEILDFSRFAVPRGSLEFTRASLNANGLWRGRVHFDQNFSAPVWALVRITTDQAWIEAASTLEPGKPIGTAQLKVVKGPRFPFGPAPVASLDLAEGRATLRTVKAGETIFPNMLVAAREVDKGDSVTVDVTSGAAHLSFDAVSQAPGRTGEVILLKNPDNGRYFQARIEGKDKVSIKK